MQSYVYGIIIDCVYYDVGNETTTEIVVERIRHKRRLLIFVIITLCRGDRGWLTSFAPKVRFSKNCIIFANYYSVHTF